MPMPDKEYIIFCDESDITGKYYSNFYGGVLIGSSQLDRVNRRLNAEKQKLNLFGEVKWSKVTENYLAKYQSLMQAFFHEVRRGRVRVRIMFRQNVHAPVGLSAEQIEGTYFRLYYQFIKHAFGLAYRVPTRPRATLKLYFDEFPETKRAASQFKGFILGLHTSREIRNAGFRILAENIAEIRSHDHVLAQCLDIVLGAIAFRLNNKHKEIPPGKKRRGKRTVAKEKLYRSILAEISRIKPKFNIGMSTSVPTVEDKWSAPYLHWRFVPTRREYRGEFAKP